MKFDLFILKTFQINWIMLSEFVLLDEKCYNNVDFMNKSEDRLF